MNANGPPAGVAPGREAGSLAVQARSLRLRATLAVLVLFVVGIGSLAGYSDHVLRGDIEHLVGEQLRSAARLAAEEVDRELRQRIAALEAVVEGLPGEGGAVPALQSHLEDEHVLRLLFNAGYFVTDRQGVTIADFPRAVGRIGVSYADRDYVVGALRDGRPTIGRPVVGRLLGVPVLAMAVPIRDARGNVTGALAGVSHLGRDSFLDLERVGRYGRGGSYLVVDRKHRQILAATDRSRVLEVLPPVGVSPVLDRFLAGSEESAVFVNPVGVEVLASTRAVPVSGWYVATTLPTAEAFEPLRASRANVLAAAGALTVLLGALAWWVMGRQLAPAVAAARELQSRNWLAGATRPLSPGRPDEIGTLIDGFNGLLARLRERESTLVEQRRLLDAVLDGVDAHIHVKDAGGRYLYANRHVARQFGLALEDIIGRDDHQLLPPAVAAHVVASDGRVREGGGVIELEEELADASGERRWFRTRKSPIVLDGSSFAIIGFSEDITERRRAERERRDNEAKFATVFDASPVGIAIARAEDGRVTEVNDAALRILGRERGAVIGATGIELGLFADAAARRAAVAGLSARDTVDLGEVAFARTDGTAAVAAVTLRTMTVGGERCTVAMITDQTAHRQLEVARLRSQKLESLGTLAGGIAHDLNNILSAIRGNIELALEDVGPAHPARESLAEVRKAGLRAAELVRRITAFGRPKEPRRASTDLAAVLEEALRLLRPTLPAGIVLETRVEAGVPAVPADPGQVHEAVVNLTTNAVHAIGSRAGRIDYVLALVTMPDEEAARRGLAGGPYACLTVRDDGCGIAADVLPRVFDAFFTTKPVGVGSGLGLSMVYGTMKGHGGAVEVESEPGRGACVRLYFPAR